MMYIIHRVNAIACNSERFPKTGTCFFLQAVVLLLCNVSMSVQLGCFVKAVVLYLFSSTSEVFNNCVSTEDTGDTGTEMCPGPTTGIPR